jgi:hypothetical protein
VIVGGGGSIYAECVAIVVGLKPEVEARLQAEADANGVPLAEFAGRVIAEHTAAGGFRTPEELERHLMSLVEECRRLPSLDGRSADEIIGYEHDGLPYL